MGGTKAGDWGFVVAWRRRVYSVFLISANMAQREAAGMFGDAPQNQKSWWARRAWLEEPQASFLGFWLATTAVMVQFPFMNMSQDKNAFSTGNSGQLVLWAGAVASFVFMGVFHVCEYNSWSFVRKIPVISSLYAILFPERPPQRDDVNAMFDTL